MKCPKGQIPLTFFCSKCKRKVTACASTYHRTVRGKRLSAIRRHYWSVHWSKSRRNPRQNKKEKKKVARKGLPKSIIKKHGITKKAWRVFKRGKGKRKAPSPKKRRYRKVARRKRRGGGRRNYKMPLSVVLPVGLGPFIPPGPAGWATPFQAFQAGDYSDAARTAICSLTFYDPGKPGVQSEGFKLDGGNWLKAIIIGTLVHKFVGGWPINLNKQAIFRKLPFNI